MSQFILLTLASSRHGNIAGSAVKAGFEGLIEVFSTSHEIAIESSSSSIRSRGRTKHDVFAITKGIDKATVLLYDSLIRSERFSDMRLDCYNTGEDGSLSKFYSVELKDARIASIKQQLADPSLSPISELEVVSFTYGTITWLFADGSLEASGNTTLLK